MAGRCLARSEFYWLCRETEGEKERKKDDFATGGRNNAAARLRQGHENNEITRNNK